MTDKELRKMRRGDLLEIIHKYQSKEKELMEENEALKKELSSRRIKIQNAGSIAEAAVAINGVFEAAQKAADQYLNELYARGTESKEKPEEDKIEIDIEDSKVNDYLRRFDPTSYLGEDNRKKEKKSKNEKTEKDKKDKKKNCPYCGGGKCTGECKRHKK